MSSHIRFLRAPRFSLAPERLVAVCLAVCVGWGGVCASAGEEEIQVDSVLLSVIHSAEVPSRDAGVVTEWRAREGSRVEAGEILARLDTDEAELALKQSRKHLEMAVAEHRNDLRQQLAKKSTEVARAELQRAEEANRKFPETVSRTELDRLRLMAEKGEIDIRQAQHEHRQLGMTAELRAIEVEQGEHAVERRLIRSPLAGVVVRIDHRQGEWVQPGMSMVRIINTTQLRAEGVLPGKYRQLDLVGRVVKVAVPLTEQRNQHADSPGKPNSTASTAAATPPEVTGYISFVHPEIDPVDGSFRVWATLDNEQQALRPGDSVSMRIDLAAEPISRQEIEAQETTESSEKADTAESRP